MKCTRECAGLCALGLLDRRWYETTSCVRGGSFRSLYFVSLSNLGRMRFSIQRQ